MRLGGMCKGVGMGRPESWESQPPGLLAVCLPLVSVVSVVLLSGLSDFSDFPPFSLLAFWILVIPYNAQLQGRQQDEKHLGGQVATTRSMDCMLSQDGMQRRMREKRTHGSGGQWEANKRPNNGVGIELIERRPRGTGQAGSPVATHREGAYDVRQRHAATTRRGLMVADADQRVCGGGGRC